jgi:hypothetical protein
MKHKAKKGRKVKTPGLSSADNSAGEGVIQAQPFMGLPLYTMAEVDRLTKIARDDGIETAQTLVRKAVHADRITQFVRDVECTPREWKGGSISVTIEVARAIVSELRFRGFNLNDE